MPDQSIEEKRRHTALNAMHLPGDCDAWCGGHGCTCFQDQRRNVVEALVEQGWTIKPPAVS